MKYIQISRSDAQGSYVQGECKQEVLSALDGELDDYETFPVGTTITLTIVEMPEERYRALPEFMGW